MTGTPAAPPGATPPAAAAELRAGPPAGMRHRGWTASVRFSAEDELFIGRLDGTHDLVTFHATSVELLITAFHDAVQGYAAACTARNRPAHPAAAALTLRMGPRTHQRALQAATARNLSLNAWIEQAILRTAQIDLPLV